MERRFGAARVLIVQGDITVQAVGAEGNAAPNPMRPADLALLDLEEGALNEVRSGAEALRGEVDAFFSALTG